MIGEHTDRIYTNTPPEHIITNVVSGRKMRVQKYNFPDTVIWNPWVDKAKEIPDFGNYSYKDHPCITSTKRWWWVGSENHFLVPQKQIIRRKQDL